MRIEARVTRLESQTGGDKMVVIGDLPPVSESELAMILRTLPASLGPPSFRSGNHGKTQALKGLPD